VPDTKFIIIYDTYCGWCYGAHPVLTAVAKGAAQVKAYHRHLFQGANAHRMANGFGAQAEKYDAQIGQMSGQPFSKTYVEKILRSETEVLASELTALAAAGVRERGALAEMSLAGRLQKARFVDGVSAHDRDPIIQALIAEGVPRLEAENFDNEDNVDKAEASTRTANDWMNAVGAKGVPTLITIRDDKMSTVDLTVLMSDPSKIRTLLD